MRLEDLPPHLQRQAMEKATSRPRPARSRAGQRDGAPARYRCTTCGHESPNWPSCERHLDEQGHHRGELVLEELGR